MNGAGSSYVAEVGFELVEILEKEGIIHKYVYGASWLGVKIFSLFDDDVANCNEEILINFLVNGNPFDT